MLPFGASAGNAFVMAAPTLTATSTEVVEAPALPVATRIAAPTPRGAHARDRARRTAWTLALCDDRVKRAPGLEGCYDWGMADTTQRSKAAIEKDFLARLADAGEEALHRIGELPGGQKALTAINDLRTRVDEMAKKVRGIDAIEARVTKLEKELAALKKSKSPARRQAPRRPTG